MATSIPSSGMIRFSSMKTLFQVPTTTISASQLYRSSNGYVPDITENANVPNTTLINGSRQMWTVSKLRNARKTPLAVPNPWPPTAGYTPTTNVITVSGQTYGNGTYNISASSIYDGTVPAYKALDNDAYSWWASLPKYNSTSPWAYNGTITTKDSSNTTYSGEWIQVQLPQAIVATSYKITPQWVVSYGGTQSVNQPRVWYLFASNTGTDGSWVRLHSGTNSSWTQSTIEFTITGNSASYSYYRIVCTNLASNTSFAIAVLKIIGS